MEISMNSKMKSKYALLPFNFIRFSDKEVLINEIGDIAVCPQGTVRDLTEHKELEEELYRDLLANFIVTDNLLSPMLDVMATRLHEKKVFLEDFTALHIFVLTLRCNQNCIYCHASSQDENSVHCSMTQETMRRAIELMFQSPSKYLTMEFQGGEPSLEYDLLKYAIETTEDMNLSEGRKIEYVLCTNSIHLSERLLDLCKQYNVLISTSLDGPSWLHNKNRGKKDSYERVVAGIERARRQLGEDKVAALMTASEEALDYPEEIVDEYVKLRFPGVFLRSLNPYGLAKDNDDWNAYTERFIEFYKRALFHILQLNKEGTYIREEFAAIVLKKMLTPWSTGFVDLQSPAGTINSVIVYNYDGRVYASDESRMLAELGDYTFCLGSVHDDYEKIVRGATARRMGNVWNNETLAGCADCPIRQYCGADPVRNYSTQGDMYGYRPTSWLCRKNRAIIEFILELVVTRRDEVMPIFRKWLV